LGGHGTEHPLHADPPVRLIDRHHADAEGPRFRLAAHEPIDDVGYHGVHLRRVIHPQCGLGGAQHAQGLAVPDLVAGLAEDPIDDRLFRPLRRGDAILGARVGELFHMDGDAEIRSTQWGIGR